MISLAIISFGTVLHFTGNSKKELGLD